MVSMNDPERTYIEANAYYENGKYVMQSYSSLFQIIGKGKMLESTSSSDGIINRVVNVVYVKSVKRYANE